jgi:hypothetical protein
MSADTERVKQVNQFSSPAEEMTTAPAYRETAAAPCAIAHSLNGHVLQNRNVAYALFCFRVTD